MARDLAKALTEHMLETRSPLYRWMHENYDRLAAALSIRHRPSWEALARTAHEAGQTDSRGQAPSRHAVRSVWLRVVRDIEIERAASNSTPAAQEAQRRPARKSKAASPRPSPPRKPAQPIAFDEGEDEPDDFSKFDRTIGLKS